MSFRTLFLETDVELEEGAKMDLVLFNVIDDIAVDIRKSRKVAELPFEAIFKLETLLLSNKLITLK